MPISAIFSADFAQFVAAVDQATVKLKGFQTDAAKVETSLNRVGNSFSGQKIISDATLAAKAVTDIGGASKLTASEQARLNATLTEAIAKYQALGQSAPKSMTDLAEATKQSDTWVGSLGRSILTTAAGFITAQAAMAAVRTAVRAIGDELQYLTLHGATVADVSTNFEHLTASSSRLGSTLLGSLRDGTHGTISNFDLMKLASADLAAGLTLTDQQFGTLAKGAFALAQATGTDVKTALDTMSDAMVTGRTRSIALLTGKIDLEKAEIAFATSLGTTRDRLSEEGKLEAARAAILDSVGAATARLGEQTDGLDERVAQAQAAWANFHDELARTVATSPVLITAFDNMSTALASAFGTSKAGLIRAIADAIDTVAISLVSAARYGVEAGGFLAKEWIAVQKLFGNVAQVIDGVRVSALLLLEAMAKVSGDTTRFNALDQQLAALEAKMVDRGRALKALDSAQSGVDQTSRTLLATIETLTSRMAAAQTANRGFGASMEEVIRQTSTSTGVFETAGAAAQRNATGLISAAKASQEAAKAATDLANEYKRQMAANEAYWKSVEKIEADMYKSRTDLESKFYAEQERIAFATQQKQLAAFLAFNQSIIGLDAERLRALLAANQASAVSMNEAGTLGGEQYAGAFMTAVDAGLSTMGSAILSAIQGGGNVLQSVGSAFGKSLTESIFGGKEMVDRIKNIFGSTLGGAFNALLPGIGSLIGPLISKIGGFFKDLFGGPSKQELAGRSATDQFTAQLQQMLTVTEKLEVQQLVAAGNSEKWAVQVVRIRDAYLAAGLSADESNAAVTRLWEAEKQGGAATQAVINDIIAKTGDLGLAADKNAEAIQAMVDSFSGEDLFTQVNNAVEAVNRIGGVSKLTGEETQRLHTMVGQAIDKYRALGEEAPSALQAIFEETANATGATTDLVEQWDLLGTHIFAEAQSAVQAIDRVGGVTHLTRDEAKRLYDIIQQAIDKYQVMGEEVPPILVEMAAQTGALADQTNRAADAQARYRSELEKAAHRSGLGNLEGLTSGEVADLLVGQVQDQWGNPVSKQALEDWLNSNPGDWNRIREAFSNVTGFATGTQGRFLDFGAGTATVLHGRERVMTQGEASTDQAALSAMASELSEIKQLLRAQPRMFRDLALQVW